MNEDAIAVVTDALRRTLADAIDGAVYVGPLDDDSGEARDAAAILFLYRIAVNADLRNNTRTVPPPLPGAPPLVYDSSLPLDLYYLFTAGNRSAGGESPALTTLGKALQRMAATPNLVGLPQNETVRVTLDPVSSEELSRVWSLFPTANYRTSVVYLATPVWIDPSTPKQVGAPVTQEQYRVGPIGASS